MEFKVLFLFVCLFGLYFYLHLGPKMAAWLVNIADDVTCLNKLYLH